MVSWFQYAALLCIFISYISSLRAFRLDMPFLYKRFSYFLLFMLIGESFAVAWPKWIYQHTSLGNSTIRFYYFFHIATYLFYLYFFHEVLRSLKLKRTVNVLGIVYVVLAIVLLFTKGFAAFPYNYLFASFLMVFFSIAYYYQLLNAKELVPLKDDMAFWISTGVFIHHLGSTFALFLVNVLNYYSAAAAAKVFMVVLYAAMAMYLTYSIGYLCHRKQLSPRQ